MATLSDVTPREKEVLRLVPQGGPNHVFTFCDPPGSIDVRQIRNLGRALTGLFTICGIRAVLKKAVDSIRRELHHFENKTFAIGLKSADHEKL